ncbi:hypothetical protein FAVG1_00412 [Fusarium avenaceum]|nr:hypothetical protein FAVG1_00412 [Fusarium avenaceum]
MNFSSIGEVEFVYIFTDDNGNKVEVTAKEENDLTIKEFKVDVQNKHRIKGLVSIYHSGKELRNVFSTLSEVLDGGHGPLVFCADKTQSVATGGIGNGAFATSAPGKIAMAEGGYSTGGQSFMDGTFRGGRGIGGDGEGLAGHGGNGRGGAATTPQGYGIGGRATAGQFHKRG